MPPPRVSATSGRCACALAIAVALAGCAGTLGPLVEPDEDLAFAETTRRPAHLATPAPACACAADEVCCNASCGICAKSGDACTADACD